MYLEKSWGKNKMGDLRDRRHREWNDWFDSQYGIETNFELPLEKAAVVGPNKVFGKRYQGTHVQNFFKFFKKFQEEVISKNPSMVLPAFVDLGCGAGRVLIMASSLGFRKLYGVDFVPDLIQTCQENWNSYLRRIVLETRENQIDNIPELKLSLSDVLAFSPPKEEKAFLFYLFNPFQEKILSLWLNRLPLFMNQTQRKNSFILYMNPIYKMEFAKAGFQTVFKCDAQNFNDNFILYKFPSESLW